MNAVNLLFFPQFCLKFQSCLLFMGLSCQRFSATRTLGKSSQGLPQGLHNTLGSSTSPDTASSGQAITAARSLTTVNYTKDNY